MEITIKIPDNLVPVVSLMEEEQIRNTFISALMVPTLQESISTVQSTTLTILQELVNLRSVVDNRVNLTAISQTSTTTIADVDFSDIELEYEEIEDSGEGEGFNTLLSFLEQNQ